MPRGNAVNGSSFVWPCTMWRLGDDTAHGRPRPRTLQATNDEGRCRLLAWRRVTGGRGSPRDLGHGGPQPRTRQNPRSERCDGALDGAAIALTRPAVASIPPRPPPERCEDRFIPQSWANSGRQAGQPGDIPQRCRQGHNTVEPACSRTTLPRSFACWRTTWTGGACRQAGPRWISGSTRRPQSVRRLRRPPRAWVQE